MSDPDLQSDGLTLRNKLGIEGDPKALALDEASLVSVRAAELKANGLPQAHGFELVKATHGYLFQDVYFFSGQLRRVVLAKEEHEGGRRHFFVAPARIEFEGKRIFQDLAAQNYLKGLGPSQFADALSDPFIRLNEVHAFREGNGRTQRLVWEHIAKEAGHDLSFDGISKERMVTVSISASQGDSAPVRRMFAELLDPVRAKALREAALFLEKNRSKDFDWHDRYVATTAAGQSYRGTFVTGNNNHFIMHDGQCIFIGNKLDLPNAGANLASGDTVEFTTANRHIETDRRTANPARKGLPGSPPVDIEQVKSEGRATIKGWNRELQQERENERRTELEQSKDRKRGRDEPDRDLDR